MNASPVVKHSSSKLCLMAHFILRASFGGFDGLVMSIDTGKEGSLMAKCAGVVYGERATGSRVWPPGAPWRCQLLGPCPRKGLVCCTPGRHGAALAHSPPPRGCAGGVGPSEVCKLHLVLFICVSALGRFFCYVVTIVAFYFFNIILYSFQLYSLVV